MFEGISGAVPDLRKSIGAFHEGFMAKRYVFAGIGALIFLSCFAAWLVAQDRGQDSAGNVIRVVVSMVQLNVAVTDSKGNYVTTLRPSDFELSEDGIPEKVATFEEGNEGPQNLLDAAQDPAPPKDSGGDTAADHRRNDPPRGVTQTSSMEGIASAVSGSNVFILFDTSNYMFRGRGFVFHWLRTVASSIVALPVSGNLDFGHS